MAMNLSLGVEVFTHRPPLLKFSLKKWYKTLETTLFLVDALADIQAHATRWLRTYNNERPNMGIGPIMPQQQLVQITH